MQRRRNDIVSGIQHMDTAFLEFCEIVRLKHNVPAFDFGVRTKALRPRLAVESNARLAPHVVDGVLVTGIVSGETTCDFRPDVPEVLEFVLVEFLENTGFNLPLEELSLRNDNIMLRLSGEQFGFECFIGIKGIVLNFYAGFFREILGPL